MNQHRLRDTTIVAIRETERAGTVDGYHMLAVQIARQAYDDMEQAAYEYFCLSLDEDELCRRALRHKEYLLLCHTGTNDLRVKALDPARTREKAKRQFNVIASWFANGDFELWFGSEIGMACIDRAKANGRKRARGQSIHKDGRKVGNSRCVTKSEDRMLYERRHI